MPASRCRVRARHVGSRRAIASLVVASLVVAALVITAAVLAPSPARAGGDDDVPRYAAPGRYAAGVTTLSIGDRSVEVWYPVKRRRVTGAVRATYDLAARVPPAIATLLPEGTQVTFETDAYRDVRAARRRKGFPLVLMTHGFAGYREQLSYLATHLATWGFVVASPDILERGLAAALGQPPAEPRDELAVMRSTVALLRAENTRPTSPLRRRIRTGALALVGQAEGGTAALRFATDLGAAAVVAISASGFDVGTQAFPDPPPIPTLYVTGAADQLVPLANVVAGFERAVAPARLVTIEAAGHANLTDICRIGGDRGLVGVAERASLPVPDDLARLATDGCVSPAPDPDPAWPVARHVATAHLREAFGADRRPVGLDAATMGRFRPVAVQYREHG